MAPKVPIIEIGAVTLAISVARMLHKEEVDDKRHQSDCDHQSQFRIVQRCADGRAGVDGNGHIDVGRHRRFQMWQLGLHIIDGLDNVGPGLAEQGDEDSGSSVGPTKVAHILDGILHVGHIR